MQGENMGKWRSKECGARRNYEVRRIPWGGICTAHHRIQNLKKGMYTHTMHELTCNTKATTSSKSLHNMQKRHHMLPKGKSDGKDNRG